jgi:hypothetical protein
MKKIIVMCHANPNISPRPNRMLRWLKDDFDVLAVAPSEAKIEGVRSMAYRPAHTNKYIAAFMQTFLRYFHLLFGRYEEVNWQSLPGARNLIPALAAGFSGQVEDDKSDAGRARILPAQLQRQLVLAHDKKTGQRAPVQDLSENVRQGDYRQPRFGGGISPRILIEAEIVMSLPNRQDLQPSMIQPGVIRLIHNGNANPSRKTELMLELMDYIDDRFTLDLMMVVTDAAYWNKIVKMADARKNVRIVPSVPMTDIVKTINQ